jgi:hypothetical protein
MKPMLKRVKYVIFTTNLLNMVLHVYPMIRNQHMVHQYIKKCPLKTIKNITDQFLWHAFAANSQRTLLPVVGLGTDHLS